MSRKKLAITILVIFIILVAVIALILKARINSGTAASLSGKASASGNPDISSDISSDTSDVSKELDSVSPVAKPIDTADLSLSALPISKEAPKKEAVKKDDIPAQAVRLNISAEGFSPSEFRVKAGAATTLALTATDGNTHVFIFPNASLMGLTTMVFGGETKIVTFKAPAAGSFSFRDDIPGYNQNIGTMIVE